MLRLVRLQTIQIKVNDDKRFYVCGVTRFKSQSELDQQVYNSSSSFQSDEEREVTADDLKNLAYLERCIKEVMGLYPQVLLKPHY